MQNKSKIMAIHTQLSMKSNASVQKDLDFSTNQDSQKSMITLWWVTWRMHADAFVCLYFEKLENNLISRNDAISRCSLFFDNSLCLWFGSSFCIWLLSSLKCGGLLKQKVSASNLFQAGTSVGKQTWILFHLPVQLPIPAYLLTLIYFFLTILAISMLVGLRTKKTRLVLAWIIFFLLSVVPEGGMVLFMSVYSWVRIMVQAISFQSLFYWLIFGSLMEGMKLKMDCFSMEASTEWSSWLCGFAEP